MSAMALAAPCVYSFVQDRAVSRSGADLRESIRAAIAPREPFRAEAVLNRISASLRAARDHDGILVDIEPFHRMIELLTVLPSNVPVPAIVIESENQIGLDWDRGARRVLSLTIGPTPYVGYSALIGHEPTYGRAPFAGQIPKTVRFLLERVFEE